ncbi:expressed unknown protein [Seminavis robusta]|uniref:Uncharacterized protein n=1 Tax=Seminavis robusta TaxID=568900 RepID=A0A9N8D8V8_9STRA|nr:expressed unknown protein [Seminavis robusta]|eukprot:Sro4_g002960.1 n/a (232) ;mRNA; r:18586-19368
MNPTRSLRIATTVVAALFAPCSFAFAPTALTKTSCTGTSLSCSTEALLPPIETTPASHPLIQAAHKFAYSQSGFYSPYDESVLAEDFVFRGPYIGPLNKKDYLSTMDTFGIYKALPDISPNCFGYTLDPDNPKRVWFMGCPETFSVTFDDDQKIKYLSVGYVADRFEGNTNGKGAAVGIFHVIGFPFPSPGPLLTFVQWLGTEVVDMGAKSYSKDVPEWWKSQEVASEGYL